MISTSQALLRTLHQINFGYQEVIVRSGEANTNQKRSRQELSSKITNFFELPSPDSDVACRERWSQRGNNPGFCRLSLGFNIAIDPTCFEGRFGPFVKLDSTEECIRHISPFGSPLQSYSELLMQRLTLLRNQISKSYDNIILEQRGAVGIIYMNNPKNLNAMTLAMRAQIPEALIEFEERPEIKVIVILSKIPKAFSVGGDIKEFMGYAKNPKLLNKDVFQNYYNTFRRAKKVIIAGVNGAAYGGGLETALLSDIVFLSENAKVGLPEITLGLIPAVGGSQRLTRVVGKNLAMKHILTGEPIDAAKIKELGTVDVLPVQNFDQQVLSYAQKIASKSVTAIITAKMAVNASVNFPLHQGEQFERAIFYPLFTTEGAKEGISAFVEKRKPDFTAK